jgi:uncharacterized protein HemY
MSLDDDYRYDHEARRREAQRPLDEAGEGEAEGFEQAEEDLIEHASHGDQHGTAKITQDAGDLDEEYSDADYGEADDEQVGD